MKVFFFVFQVSLLENLFSILDILFVILFREAFISVTLAVGLFIFFFSIFFLEEESFSRYSDVVEIIFLSFLIFEGKMKLSFPLFDSISWKRETLFDVVVFLIFLKGVFLLFPGFSFLLSLPWVLFFSSNDYFLLLSYVSTLFYFFRERYFFSFLFLFLDFVSSFRHFRKKEIFFYFPSFLFDVLSMLRRIFKVFSSRKKKVVNDEIEIASGILTPLRILLDFRCSRNFSCFDWNYRALLNIRNFSRYYADIVSRNYEESSDWSIIYSSKLSPTLRNLPWEWWNVVDREIRLWDYLSVIPDEYWITRKDESFEIDFKLTSPSNDNNFLKI